MHASLLPRPGAARPRVTGPSPVAGALAFLAVFVLTGWASPAAAGEIRTLTASLSAAGVESLRLDVPVGEVRIDGGGDRISAEITLACDDDHRGCRQAAERVRLESETRGHRARLAVVDWPENGDRGLELQMTVHLPRRLTLSLKLGVGELHATDLGGDLGLEVGVGEAHLDLDESAVRTVEISVGVGEATLVVDGHRIEGSGFLGRSVDWKGGSGTSRVAVDCGVGEVTVDVN